MGAIVSKIFKNHLLLKYDLYKMHPLRIHFNEFCTYCKFTTQMKVRTFLLLQKLSKFHFPINSFLSLLQLMTDLISITRD